MAACLLVIAIHLEPTTRANAAAPYASPLPAIKITPTNATLSGMCVANGEQTLAWFEWGTNQTFGQTTPPTNIGVGAGVVYLTSTVGNLTPGGIYCFRLQTSNSSAQVASLTQRFTTGLKVASWGDTQTPLPGITNAVGVASSSNIDLALKNDGRVIAWTGASQTNAPATWSNLVAVSSSDSYALGLRSDGTLVAWPWTPIELCNMGGPFFPSLLPADLTNVVAVAAGGTHVLVLRADGKVLAWGAYCYGSTNVPAGLSNVVAIAAGDSHSLALKADGTVVAWGGNFHGPAYVPPIATNVVAIAANSTYSVGLRADGTVLAWGIVTSVRTNLAAATNIVAVSAGDCIGLAMTGDGSVFGWRQFGCSNGTYDETNIPAGLSNAVSLFGGFGRSLAIAPNVPPSATSLVVTGYVNHDLTIALKASDPNGDPLSFQVASLPSRGALYQYASGSRGAAVVSPNTPVTDSAGRLVFVPATDGSESPYASFNFNANDGEFTSPTATVTVNITLPTPPLITSVLWNGTNSFQLTLTGTSNSTYSVWISTNLLTWQKVGTAQETSPGVFSFTDSSATNAPNRFYRAAAP